MKTFDSPGGVTNFKEGTFKSYNAAREFFSHTEFPQARRI